MIALAGLVPASRTASPAAASVQPNHNACDGRRRSEGTGRDAVRRMRLSGTASKHWFSVNIPAPSSATPSSVYANRARSGIPGAPIQNPAAATATTSAFTRGLVSSR